MRWKSTKYLYPDGYAEHTLCIASEDEQTRSETVKAYIDVFEDEQSARAYHEADRAG